jgi:hypothetical protein
MKRMSQADRRMALKRIEDANRRIANLEAAVRRLKDKGEPTVEAERLLRLMRQSRSSDS